MSLAEILVFQPAHKLCNLTEKVLAYLLSQLVKSACESKETRSLKADLNRPWLTLMLIQMEDF